jgi:Fe-S cluster biogenesis protein NfuA
MIRCAGSAAWEHLLGSERCRVGAGPSGCDNDRSGERRQHDPGDTLRAQVEETLEAIRPAIQADGGDIDLVSVDPETGVVVVELTGACVSCPASTVTLKAGIERIMKDRVEGVTEVRNANDDAAEGTAVML